MWHWQSRVLEALGGGRRSGEKGYWMCRCPAHEDRRPSLKLSEGSRKPCLMVHCLAGCRTDAVLKSAGLKMSDLFPPEEGKKDLPPRRVVAVYDYEDEKCNLLFQAVRYEPKNFSQRRPDGKGGWAWNLDGVRRVLFNLPEVLADPRQPVLVVEGEKDVLTLQELGFVATTCPCGSGSWLDEHAEQLAGRRVVVIPDNDAAGWRFAARVAGSLLVAGAASVRAVQLPVAVGEDVSDWAAWLGTEGKDARKALIEVIRRTPEWAPKAS